jgi:hypothetical protein
MTKKTNRKPGSGPKPTHDNKPKQKMVDLLEVDKPIAGQNFTCISFISPEKILKDKNLFLFECFLKNWEFNKSMEKFIQFNNFISYKYNIPAETLKTDYEEFVKEEGAAIREGGAVDDYKNFLDMNEEKLEQEFNKKHDFQTSTRGVKIRGSFSTQEEAEFRCKLLREIDPNFDIFVGPVGQWLCWEPEAYKTGRTEYLEDELNKLVHEKTKNEANAKSAFEQRVREAKEKAIQENIEKAEKSGNVLTQTINENGELVGISGTNTQETFLLSKENVTSTEIIDELFEGENIVINSKK